MPSIIRSDGEYAVENSSYLIVVEFLNELGQAVTPKTGVWHLTDLDGNIINSRENVNFSPLQQTTQAFLFNLDLALSSGFVGRFERRVFTVEYTYDSDYKVDAPGLDHLEFPILNNVYKIAS